MGVGNGVVVSGNKEVMYGNGGVNTSGLHSHRVSPNHYYVQNTNCGSQPFNSFGQIHIYNSQAQPQGYHSQMGHVSGYDPFIMTYSGPYSATTANVPSQVVPTLPFAVPTFLQAQGSQPFGSAAPTMATVTTHSPYYHHQVVGSSKIPSFQGYTSAPQNIQPAPQNIQSPIYQQYYSPFVDPSKIECIRNWAKPKTLKGLRGFLGLAGYYRKFVRNFGIIAKPLTNMLKLGGFTWTPESEVAFEALKTAMTSTPVLALPDFTKEFVIECDASGVGIGAVLSQQGHPIAYLSKALAPRHIALSVYDKEMLAVVYAVEHWRTYLLGHHFRIYTDHRTIEYFLGQRITTPAQQKWLLKLIGYDYSIHYKAGKK